MRLAFQDVRYFLNFCAVDTFHIFQARSVIVLCERIYSIFSYYYIKPSNKSVVCSMPIAYVSMQTCYDQGISASSVIGSFEHLLQTSSIEGTICSLWDDIVFV